MLYYYHTGDLVRELQEYLDKKEKPPYGLRAKVKKALEASPFKDVSPFIRFLGDDQDLINRIALDPAHEFHNLVKDYLMLICDQGKMKLKEKYLANEQANGRFEDIVLGEAPWHVSKKLKNILNQLVRWLKIPSGWPALLDYFTDDTKKMKLAEGLAFCGDIGCYLTDLTDLRADVKAVFVELLRVSGGFVGSRSKQQTQEELAQLQKQLVHFQCCI